MNDLKIAFVDDEPPMHEMMKTILLGGKAKTPVDLFAVDAHEVVEPAEELSRIFHESICCKLQEHVISGRAHSSLLNVPFGTPPALIAVRGPTTRTLEAFATIAHEISGLSPRYQIDFFSQSDLALKALEEAYLEKRGSRIGIQFDEKDSELLKLATGTTKKYKQAMADIVRN